MVLRRLITGKIKPGRKNHKPKPKNNKERGYKRCY